MMNDINNNAGLKVLNNVNPVRDFTISNGANELKMTKFSFLSFEEICAVKNYLLFFSLKRIRENAKARATGQ